MATPILPVRTETLTEWYPFQPFAHFFLALWLPFQLFLSIQLDALDKEEKEWLEQFDDVPVEDIYESDSKVKKYRKKPIVIEAYRTDKEFDIPTPEGVMKASVGDYIITGVSGEQYPCKPDIFWESYEEVDD